MSLVAVVTGANKGLGYSVVQGLLQEWQDRGVVYLTARDEARGSRAVASLEAEGLRPRFHPLDVTSRDSVAALAEHLRREHAGLDILIHNAGVGEAPGFDFDGCKRVIDTNYYSALLLQELVFPLLKRGARVLHVSSDCGHLSNVRNPYWLQRLSNRNLTETDIEEFVQWYLDSRRHGTFRAEDLADRELPSYRVAKVALSALSVVQARALAARGVSVNSVHPGLVRTDMTGGVGFLSAREAARTLLHVVLRAPAHLTGAYIWHDGSQLDWFDHTANYYFKYDSLLADYSERVNNNSEKP